MASREKKDVAAVKLPFETGEYLTTWQLPDRKGGTINVHGLLTVEPGKYPFGTLHGTLPIETIPAGSGAMATFPQRYSFDTLIGQLSTGAYVALMNGQLDYWFDSQGRATGAFAVLSRDKLDAAAHKTYTTIELQIEGLESVAGVAPIAKVKMPMKAGDEPVWEATINQDVKLSWTAGGQSMVFSYNYSARALDFFEFTIAFGPVLAITSTQPLPVVDWWLNWVRPLRQLISLITRGPREVRYFLAGNDGEHHSALDQVFGWDITHVPVNSARATFDAVQSSVRLAEDSVSLLDLLKKWQELTAAHHPLFETYGDMTTQADQSPRSRFLLLLQALEGSYGFEHRTAHEADKAKYATKRAEVIGRVEAAVSETDTKFIDKNLRKEPQQGLDSALAEVLKRLPGDVSKELEATDLVKKVRADDTGKGTLPLQTALTRARNVLSHGSGVFGLHELDVAADLLERIVQAEAVRLLGAPTEAQERAIKKPDR